MVLLVLPGPGTALLQAQCGSGFQRGDANADNKLDLSDPIFTLGFLFRGTGEPSCLDTADADDSGRVDLTDAVFTVSHLFQGGPALPPPALGACGLDPTQDLLECASYAPCAGGVADQCTSNECCDAASYCEKAIADCDGVGTCVARPDICPRIFDPVCGCDGQTYSNPCAAASAGVNVAVKGECDRPPGCLSSKECNDADYCAKPEGGCDEPGECLPRPFICPLIFDPVCGCDGITYASDCEAAANGASVAVRGECQRGDPCGTSADCDATDYCVRGDGRCAGEGEGVCLPRPEFCTFFLDPICGCDDLQYDNSCFAAVAGIDVKKYGPCDDSDLCKSDEECDGGEFCARREGQCDNVGFCRQRLTPAECVQVPADPVCGCDDVTYDNACLATAAGVGVARRGPCEFGRPCNSNADCVEEAWCLKPEGFCGDPGICIPDTRVADCEGQPEFPVCGCDNVTYRNHCEAYAAGTSIAYPEACDGIPRCASNLDCDAETYCQYQNFACGGLGKCQPRPIECPEDLIDPVCGCDKKTYRNPCMAARAGVSIAFLGSCNGGGGDCQTNLTCGGELYCLKSEGDCDGSGQCDALPVDCADDPDPVCGCDGITYDNECRAHQAGVNVLRKGACP